MQAQKDPKSLQILRINVNNKTIENRNEQIISLFQ